MMEAPLELELINQFSLRTLLENMGEDERELFQKEKFLKLFGMK